MKNHTGMRCLGCAKYEHSCGCFGSLEDKALYFRDRNHVARLFRDALRSGEPFLYKARLHEISTNCELRELSEGRTAVTLVGRFTEPDIYKECQIISREGEVVTRVDIKPDIAIRQGDILQITWNMCFYKDASDADVVTVSETVH